MHKYRYNLNKQNQLTWLTSKDIMVMLKIKQIWDYFYKTNSHK